MQASKNSKHQIGFTLLELLLAISISVVISAGSYRTLSASAEAILYLTKAQSTLKPIQELQWLLRHYSHTTILSRSYVESEDLTDARQNADSITLFGVFEPGRTSYLQARGHNTQHLSTSRSTPTIKTWQDQITALMSGSFEDPEVLVAQTLDSNPHQGRLPYTLKIKLSDKSIGELSLKVSR